MPLCRTAALLCLPVTAALAAEPAPAGDAKPTRFEGAIGLVSSYAPEYAGAEASSWRFRPAGFVRYGRLTISGAGGFTTRRDDDVERGVAAELVKKKTFKVSLSARWTTGRNESESDRLTGMGDIQGTLLARLRLQWEPEGPWRYSLAVNTDTLGHGNGWTVDVGLHREWRPWPRTRLQLGTSASFGSDSYMQSWYGVSAAQSERSGYPVCSPGNGLRDIGVGTTLRHDFSSRWSGYVGTSANWQIGAAAKSPLVQRRLGWSVGTGLVWRF